MDTFMQSQFNDGFYTQEELHSLGFKEIGKHVLISKLARIYGASKISIGNYVRIDDFVILSGKITIGSFIHIGAFSAITGGRAGVVLGDFCNMSSQSKIFAVTDNFIDGSLMGCLPDEFKNVKEIEVILTKHCNIGSHSLVLPGSQFEIGSRLGPMSLNMGRKFDAWGYYFGNPARRMQEVNQQATLASEEKLIKQLKSQTQYLQNNQAGGGVSSSFYNIVSFIQHRGLENVG